MSTAIPYRSTDYLIEKLLNFGLTAIFLSHGILAICHHEPWFEMLNFFGFNRSESKLFLSFFGSIDILVACILMIKPFVQLYYWTFFWGLTTALARPLSGESILEFFERTPNWLIPLILIIIWNSKFKSR